MPATPQWKDFESLVERLQRSFHAAAKVTRNDRIRGKTGCIRQIDISIRYKLGPSDVFMIVDCKKRSRKVDLPALEAFDGLKKDVGAHVGILVNEKGFTKHAQRAAPAMNIELFTFRDTQRPDWQCRARVDVCIEEWLLVPTVFRLERKDGSSEAIGIESDFELVDAQSAAPTSPAALFRRLWAEHPEKKPGPVCYSLSVGPNAGEQNDKLLIGFEAQAQRYVRQASLALVGLTNVMDGLTYTSEANVVTTGAAARFHETDDACPDPACCLAIMLKTTRVKTVGDEQRRINLQKNRIQLTLGSAGMPLSFLLR